MKPMKILLPLALWLLRSSLVILAYGIFFNEVISFSLSGIHYFVAAGFLFFSVLLFIGGFLKKPTLTVFSALVVFILSTYKIFDLFDISMPETMAPFALSSATGLLFAAIGNKT